MAFDFENNILLDDSIDIYDDSNLIYACNDILKPYQIETELTPKKETIYMSTNNYGTYHNKHYLFLSFLSLYDRIPTIFNLYKWNNYQVFYDFYKLGYQEVTVNSILDDDTVCCNRDLILKYFHYKSDGDMIKIKYDIPMILSYFYFMNQQLDYLIEDPSHFYIQLCDKNIKISPEIISKDDLVYFILTVLINASKFYRIRVLPDVYNMLTQAIQYHYDIVIRTHNTGHLPYMCSEIYGQLCQGGIVLPLGKEYSLPIFYDPTLRL